MANMSAERFQAIKQLLTESGYEMSGAEMLKYAENVAKNNGGTYTHAQEPDGKGGHTPVVLAEFVVEGVLQQLSIGEDGSVLRIDLNDPAQEALSLAMQTIAQQNKPKN